MSEWKLTMGKPSQKSVDKVVAALDKEYIDTTLVAMRTGMSNIHTREALKIAFKQGKSKVTKNISERNGMVRSFFGACYEFVFSEQQCASQTKK